MAMKMTVLGNISVHKILTARAANSAMINRESGDCSIKGRTIEGLRNCIPR